MDLEGYQYARTPCQSRALYFCSTTLECSLRVPEFLRGSTRILQIAGKSDAG
jgi:hypothetical protein